MAGFNFEKDLDHQSKAVSATVAVFGGLSIIVFDFFVLKNGRGAGGEFHFSKLLIIYFL